MDLSKTSQRLLNKEQQEAVDFGEGPLLIIAGAGTGKTTVVSERIKYLITNNKAKPSEILALTFTEKAAREMEERVDVIMPYGYTNMWISTFHKFCDRVLRSEAIHIGLNPAYRLMTDTDSTMLFRTHLFDFHLDYFRPLGNPTKFISGILQHFSRLADEDISPEQYMKWAQNVEEPMELKKYLELAHTYKKYQEIKTKEGLMDFGDLITYTLRLFRTRKNLLTYYQKQFTYILVDEFQDTNIAQNELVVLMAGSEQNITAVCDDDQSIYKFRGAAVSNVLSFRKHFPKAALLVLSKNYRSTQAILDASYTLIQHNNPDRLEVKEGINKKLVSERNIAGDLPELMYVDRVEQEADEVAKKIKSMDKFQWKDFAILVRANAHAEPFVRALSQNGIPYQFLGPGQLFRQGEIKDLIAYLQILDHFDNDIAFFRVLSMPFFAFAPRDIAELSNIAKKKNTSLFAAAEEDEKFHDIVEMIHRHLGLVVKESAGQILYYFLEDSGMIKHIVEYKAPISEAAAQNIAKFFNKLKTYETDHEDASVQSVLEWIELSMSLGESPMAGDTDWVQNNAVNILTIHSAKGLEFPVVFLVNLVGARFPSRERREQIPVPEDLIKEELPQGDYHLEEERRLFYVGMTRARDMLYITAANFYGEGKREKKLSPFVFEVFGETIPNPEPVASQISLLDWHKEEVQPQSIPPTKIIYLSYSQIDTFRICPLHYKLRYVLNIPSSPSAALSFGTSIHGAMQEFYTTHGRGENVSKELLQQTLVSHWKSEGYKGKPYEEEMKKRGARYLSDYFDQEYDAKTTIASLELPFTVPIPHDGRVVKIGGKIDRIDVLPGGGIEIIDYKTGKPPTKREVDANLQLSMYALAATEIPGAPLGRKPEDITLTLYFFETQQRISTTRSALQLAQEKENIWNIVKEIESSDFTCSGNILCNSCEYKLFCGL